MGLPVTVNIKVQSAVFIDRDGVINKKMPEGDYVKDWSEFSFLPGVFEGLRILKDKGFLLIVVTNQRCIARGIITEEKLKEIHKLMINEMEKNRTGVNAIYHCPHENNEKCDCRKPEPGMILRAANDFMSKGIQIDMEKSYMIGDSEKDILAGKAVKLRTILIGETSDHADGLKRSLLDAAKSITGLGGKNDN